MRIYVNGTYTEGLLPKYVGEEIVVAIDSSKRNSAFTVGDTHRHILDYYEFDGKDDGTSEYDALELCFNQRKALKQLFTGAVIKYVGIEDIITKKEQPGKQTGMYIHSSRFKITAVFNSFISFFQDNFGITPELVNNQTWKAATLPPEFRKRDVGKGSLAYFKSINSKYQYCSDDVTDSICIYTYLCDVHKLIDLTEIDELEVARHNHQALLVATNENLNGNVKLFKYNPEYTLEQNIAFIVNNIDETQFGVTVLDINALTFKDIYTYCKGNFTEKESVVKLVVCRRE